MDGCLLEEELSLTLFVWGLDVCLFLEVFILELEALYQNSYVLMYLMYAPRNICMQ